MCYIDCVFVPQQESLQAQLLKIYYDTPSGGHFGHDKILDLVRKHFIWSGMAEDVREYIATCLIYQSKAVYYHKSYKELESLLIPTDLGNALFKEISLDWIIGLPVSRYHNQEYDSILTIICHATKYTLFILMHEALTAVKFTELFFKHIKCHFGIS